MFAFDLAILSIHYRIVLRLVSESTLSPAAPPACERVYKDMTSLFEPNLDVLNLFRGFPAWSRVVASESVQTVRLDDVAEAAGVTFLQMDVQGAELLALQHAQVRLRETVVLHLEVLFLPLYLDQPLFSDVEQLLRHRGYVFHCFSRRRPESFSL